MAENIKHNEFTAPHDVKNIKKNFTRRRFRRDVENHAGKFSDTNVNTLCAQVDTCMTLEDQTDSLINQLIITDSEVRLFSVLIADLKNVLQKIACNINPTVFGSMLAGTAFKNSDVDVFLFPLDFVYPSKADIKAFMFMCRRAMTKSGLFLEVVVIANARVPVMKAFHLSTGKNVDISLCSHSGFYNSLLIKVLCSDPRIRQLICLLLIWAKYFNIKTSLHISSFTVVLFAIFYLQTVNILPPLYKVLKLRDHDWPINFKEDVKIFNNDVQSSLDSLLLGFFIFYSELNYEDFVISPFAGALILKSAFTNHSLLPECLEIYIKLIMKKQFTELDIKYPVCVQEPLFLNANTTRGMSTDHVKHFKLFCLETCKSIRDCQPNLYLYKIYNYRCIYTSTNSFRRSFIEVPSNMGLDTWHSIITHVVTEIFQSILCGDTKPVLESDICKSFAIIDFKKPSEKSDHQSFFFVHLPFNLLVSSRDKLGNLLKPKNYSDFQKEMKVTAICVKESNLEKLNTKLFISIESCIGKGSVVDICWGLSENTRTRNFINKLEHDWFIRLVKAGLKHILQATLVEKKPSYSSILKNQGTTKSPPATA